MNLLTVRDLSKTFTLHLRGGMRIHSLQAQSLSVQAGECVVLRGPSGAGKSTLLRCIYGNYRADSGQILAHPSGRQIDLMRVTPREIIALRRTWMAYASQFLRAMPRVSCLDLVARIGLEQGQSVDEARDRERDMLMRLQIPAQLHGLPPVTFSGGEQQRVNLARCFVGEHPLLLLDEPTASLDAGNSAIVVECIRAARAAGKGILAVFHDPALSAAVADREVSLTPNKEMA